jgi:hypothetical protein
MKLIDKKQQYPTALSHVLILYYFYIIISYNYLFDVPKGSFLDFPQKKAPPQYKSSFSLIFWKNVYPFFQFSS